MWSRSWGGIRRQILDLLVFAYVYKNVNRHWYHVWESLCTQNIVFSHTIGGLYVRGSTMYIFLRDSLDIVTMLSTHDLAGRWPFIGRYHKAGMGWCCCHTFRPVWVLRTNKSHRDIGCRRGDGVHPVEALVWNLPKMSYLLRSGKL